MPEQLESCVKKLMNDPDFKPKKGQTKKEAAYAVCTASYQKANSEYNKLMRPEDYENLSFSELYDLDADFRIHVLLTEIMLEKE